MRVPGHKLTFLAQNKVPGGKHTEKEKKNLSFNHRGSWRNINHRAIAPLPNKKRKRKTIYLSTRKKEPENASIGKEQWHGIGIG